MKNGTLVMTNHYGEDNATMMGLVIKTRCRQDRTTCDILWSNGDMQEFIDPRWLVNLEENN